MNTLELLVEEQDREERIPFKMRRMIDAGYTGRNQEAVRKHIEELKREGVPAPDSVPAAFEVITKLIYFDDEIEVIGEKTSGEAEFVLLCSDKDVYVGVGSDHTDRELEPISVIKSKQMCPNVMSSRVWRLQDVRKDWDEMMLRSWVEDEKGVRTLYQEAALSAMMAPEELMGFVKDRLDDKNLEGVVIYSGTVPILTEKTNYNPYFEVELHNPKSDKKLGCRYRVKVLHYLKEGDSHAERV